MQEAIKSTAIVAENIPKAPKISRPTIRAEGALIISPKMPMMGNASKINEKKQTDRSVDVGAMV